MLSLRVSPFRSAEVFCLALRQGQAVFAGRAKAAIAGATGPARAENARSRRQRSKVFRKLSTILSKIGGLIFTPPYEATGMIRPFSAACAEYMGENDVSVAAFHEGRERCHRDRVWSHCGGHFRRDHRCGECHRRQAEQRVHEHFGPARRRQQVILLPWMLSSKASAFRRGLFIWASPFDLSDLVRSAQLRRLTTSACRSTLSEPRPFGGPRRHNPRLGRLRALRLAGEPQGPELSHPLQRRALRGLIFLHARRHVDLRFTWLEKRLRLGAGG